MEQECPAWIGPSVQIGAALVSGIFTIWATFAARKASTEANKIAKHGADRAMEVALASRPDQLSRHLFDTKLDIYKGIYERVAKVVELATARLGVLQNGLQDQFSTGPQLFEVKHELSGYGVAYSFLLPEPIFQALIEFSPVIEEILTLPEERLSHERVEEFVNKMRDVAASVALAMRVDLDLPKLEAITKTAIEQALDVDRVQVPVRKVG